MASLSATGVSRRHAPSRSGTRRLLSGASPCTLAASWPLSPRRLPVIALGTAPGSGSSGPGRSSSGSVHAAAGPSVKAAAAKSTGTAGPSRDKCSPSGRRQSRRRADPAEAKKQEHLQKIRQLTFDRRPSAILKAWSTPRDEAIKEAENPASQVRPGRPGACRRPCSTVDAGVTGRHRAVAMPNRRRRRPARRPPPAPSSTRSIASSGDFSTTSPWATGRPSRRSWPSSPRRRARPPTNS